MWWGLDKARGSSCPTGTVSQGAVPGAWCVSSQLGPLKVAIPGWRLEVGDTPYPAKCLTEP